MIYKSCPWLEHGLFIERNYISNCCELPNSNSYLIPLLRRFSPDNFNLEQITERKRIYRNYHKKGKILPSCENCTFLLEQEWDESDKINMLNISHWHNCNCNCSYCYFEPNRKIFNEEKQFNILPVFKKMKDDGILKGDGEIHFSGGEVTVLKEFNDLMKFFLDDLNARSIFINSSGILYNEFIARGILENRANITVSTDCGTRKLYKKIKQQDTFDAVVSTLKKYVAAQPRENKNLVRIKYILLPDINSNKRDIDDFLKLACDLRIDNVLFDLETEWYKRNNYNIDNKYYDLIMYANEKAKQYGLSLGYYSYAENYIKRKEKGL